MLCRRTSCHGTHALGLDLVDGSTQDTSRTSRHRLSFGLVEADQEERYIVLPWYPSVTAEVDLGCEISVSILLVRDFEFLEVGLIMHVPAKDDRAKSKARRRDREELLLGDQLASQDTVNVAPCKLDACVVLQELRQVFDLESGGIVGNGHAVFDFPRVWSSRKFSRSRGEVTGVCYCYLCNRKVGCMRHEAASPKISECGALMHC
jgi:hypothetical protein